MTQVQFDEFGNVSILDTKKEFNIYQSSLKKKEKPPSLVGSPNSALAKNVYNTLIMLNTKSCRRVAKHIQLTSVS